MCAFLHGATKAWIEEQKVPYAFKEGEWVGYDNEESFQLKVCSCLFHGMVIGLDRELCVVIELNETDVGTLKSNPMGFHRSILSLDPRLFSIWDGCSW